MKRIVLVLLSLLSVFFVSWGVKMRIPINRPPNLDEEEETPWYESRYTAPKADEEWYLDPEIPLNYMPVPGEDELYMVLDDSGNILSYRQRTQQADGSWLWEDADPEIPDGYEKVKKIPNVYKVTGEDGKTSYVLYVRNEDDTFCFVPVDKNGVPLDDGKKADKIDDRHIHVDGNIYAVYNEENVRMGYRERVKTDSGSYIWKVAEKPDLDPAVGNGLGGQSPQKTKDPAKEAQQGGDILEATDGVTLGSSDGATEKKINGDGTYTVTEKNINTETTDGYRITYETTVYSTYDSSGTLLSTRKDGPYETGRAVVGGRSGTTDKRQIAATLDGELARVSASVDFDTAKAKEVLDMLNAERQSQGLMQLAMDENSDVYKLACIRAADMAIYDHSSSRSPLYGTLLDMISRFGISSSQPAENIWKAGSRSASDIHTRFQVTEGSRQVRMSGSYTQVGIAIVEKNGQIYVAEVYL